MYHSWEIVGMKISSLLVVSDSS